RDKGAVHLVGKTAPLKNIDDKFEADNICSCCWDCCGLFGNYHRGNMPFLLKSFYIAELADKDKCLGCQVCMDYCPLDALSLSNEGVININQERCCGCGQCSYHCPEGAIQMQSLEREVFLPMQSRTECKIPTAKLKQKDREAKNPEPEEAEEEFRASKEEIFAVMDELYEKFLEDKAKEVFKGWNKIMLFQFTDINEYWYMRVIDGIPQRKEAGFIEDADIVYIMKTGVFVKVMRGEMNAASALRRKLIKVKASVRDLIKLMKLS
ncbi:MAG: 4Fe-4S binding protein, partial [Candidatus Thorarchaeota archaeon]